MAQEKNFETRVKNWLKSEGIYDLGTPEQQMNVPPCGYFEKRWGGGYSKSGLPDMHLVVNGISIEVELKAPNGRVSAVQDQKLGQIRKSGCMGFVLYPHQFEDFQRLILGIKRRVRPLDVGILMVYGL